MTSLLRPRRLRLEGIQKAIEKNQKRQGVAGGSTISQQLAKTSSRRPAAISRKAEEAIITVMIETLWDKRRILEVYLNVVEWGNGIFGCEAAAQRYYRVSASRLTPQAAWLAVMLPNPRKYETNFGPVWPPTPRASRAACSIPIYPESVSFQALDPLGLQPLPDGNPSGRMPCFSQTRLPDAIRRIHLAEQPVRRPPWLA